MKKSKFLLLGLFLLSCNKKTTEIDSTQIFKDALQYVVEVKSVTSDDKQTFGSGVVFSSDGTLVSNAHMVVYKTGGEYKISRVYI